VQSSAPVQLWLCPSAADPRYAAATPQQGWLPEVEASPEEEHILAGDACHHPDAEVAASEEPSEEVPVPVVAEAQLAVLALPYTAQEVEPWSAVPWPKKVQPWSAVSREPWYWYWRCYWRCYCSVLTLCAVAIAKSIGAPYGSLLHMYLR
jgi:hypothetical protein